MRRVTVVYHYEDGTWWADSQTPGLEAFVAGGRDLDETRRLAREGAEFHLGQKVSLTELYDPRQVVTRLEVEHSEPSVLVWGGPSPAGNVRTRWTTSPAQPCTIAG